MVDMGPVPAEALELLEKATTGMVMDALAMAGLKGGIRGVRPSRGFEHAKVVGRAATVLYDMPGPDTPKLSMYRAIENSPPGCVLVIDGKGADGHFTGDNQGEFAKRHGLIATVVYGGARDVAGYREIGQTLYCTGSATADKPEGLRIVADNVPLDLGGVKVKPGDVIVADEDGVAAIPAEELDRVLQNVRFMFQVEERMAAAVQGDAPASEIETIIASKKPKQ